MADIPYDELEPKMLEILASGGRFHGKFTCGNCGTRQIFEEPNKLFTSGICEECGHKTDLHEWGLLAILGRGNN